MDELGFDWEIAPEPSWDECYSQLCEYHKKYKTTLLNQRINSNLAKWCKQQRKLYGSSKLEVERILKLEALGFDWDPEDEDWNAMYYRLLVFMTKNGHVLVPWKCAEDPPLGTWVGRQWTDYSKYVAGCDFDDITVLEKTCTQLESKRVPAKVHMAMLSKLIEIGFVWDRREAQWLEMYQKLIAYKEAHGSTLVPKSWKDDPKLGNWVVQQRRSNSIGQLESNRKKLLHDIDFEWDPLEAKWCEMFERLCAYKEENGNAHVPERYSMDPELASWVARQKVFHRTGLKSWNSLVLNGIGKEFLINFEFR